MNRRQALIIFALYVALAAAVLWHGVSLTHNLSGEGSDPFESTWFLAWWPYALTHHLDPFFTKVSWYPYGVSTLWVTAVPLLSLLMWPVTALGGAVLSYNLLIIAQPPLAAFCAFLLCRYVTRELWGALLGGFIFGFSPYEMAQSVGALNLSVIALMPLLLLVALMRLDDRLSRRQAVGAAALLLLAQFLVCIEVFATMLVFGGFAWALAYLYLPARRAVLRRLVVDGLITAPVVMLPLLPLLGSMARHYGLINHPAFWPYYFVTDLLGPLVPTTQTLLGAAFPGLVGSFAGDTQEQGAYLGAPLLLVVWLFARRWGAAGRGRLLVAMFLVCLLCSFGPQLWVGGHFTGIFMPWILMVHLPLLGAALSARFALFTSLAVALMAALWLAQGGVKRAVLAAVAVAALLPAPHPWRAPPDVPFFAPGEVTHQLGPDPRLMILPFAIQGPSSYWQMESGFAFTQVGGYLGFPPKPAQAYSAVMQMFANAPKPSFAADFTTYAQQSGAQYVVLGPGTNAAMAGAIIGLGWPARQVDGVTLVTVEGAGP